MIAAESKQTAHRSRSGEQFVIRPAASLAELDRCLALQQEVWGMPDLEVVPRNLFVLAGALGGHVLTAWSEHGELGGYAMAMAAHEPAPGAPRDAWMQPVTDRARLQIHDTAAPEPYLHSHQVAVAPLYQGHGLGFALKLAQREEALARGMRTMRWTFDPTMARNAWFNLGRLGATVRLYVPDFYGTNGSRLQGGLPTDRLLAEWELEVARTRLAVQRRLPAAEPIAARIQLPPALAAAKARGAQADAQQMQTALREELQRAFAQGLELCGFRPSGDDGGAYLLRPCAYGRDHPPRLVDAG